MQALSDKDKAQMRATIVAATVSSPPAIRPQLLAVAEKMIRADFPKHWPRLVDELYPLVTSDVADRVIAGLDIFHAVVDWHGGAGMEDVRGAVQSQIFPLLLGLLQARSAAANALEPESLQIVKSILKCFYSAIKYRFSPQLLLGGAFSAWCSAITHVIQLAPPAAICALSQEEADAHVYWKMKKWAVRIHNKIFQRYGCAKLDTFNNPDHMDFARLYMEHVALPVLNVYLEQIQGYLEGRNPFNERIFCFLMDYLESAIRSKKTWAVLHGHVLTLLQYFIFPRLCFTAEDGEMWEEDPEEYVRVKLDPFDEIYSAASSGVNFVLDLIKCRKKSMFLPILQFINERLASSTGDLDAARRKDGALFMLGSISQVLLHSDLKSQVEQVITSYVVPELASAHGFLRMRACWTLEQYDDLEYSQSAACLAALQGVLTCMGDKELPVRVAAAGALGALLDNEIVQKALPPYLTKIIEALLALANEIQLDSISFVMERLVTMFDEQLAPYAVQLCVQLRDTVARHLEGYQNFLDAETEDDAFGQGAEKMMAVVGMFTAINTLIESMSKVPELLASLEETVAPLVAMVLDRRVIDVYEETFNLVETISFSRKVISPCLWGLFPYIYRAFKDVGSDYIQDMQMTLDNIISFGTEGILGSPERFAMIVEIIQTTMTGEDFNEYDRVFGCKLMESMMLNCRGRIDQLIEMFIRSVMPLLADETENRISIVIPHLETIINALYYNAPLALKCLEQANFTARFFSLWFNKAPKFTRVHDKRLIIVSLGQLMALPFEQLPPVLQQNWPLVLPIYLSAIQTLPKALEERKRLEEEDPSDSEYDEDGNDDFAEEGDYDELADDDEAAEQEAAAIHQATSGGIGAHHGRGRGREELFEFDGGDSEGEEDFEEELEEELFFETPLDKLDIAGTVQQSLKTLAHSQPASFQILTHSLGAEDAKFLQSLL